MYLLAQSTASHASINHTELEISILDVRMAMQDCGALAPEKVLEEQLFDGEEDTRGMESFLAWATGVGNREIRRIALEGGDGTKEDYLTGLPRRLCGYYLPDMPPVLKKKHGSTDEDSRYHGTILGKAAEPRTIKVEGGELSSMKEWVDKLKASSNTPSAVSSRRQSSALSSLADQDLEEMDFT
jgi:transcription initiation factor TFIID subunit 3